MSGAPRRWIRLDVDWEDSPWLDALDGTASGCWPRVLCLMKRSGVGGAMRAPDLGVLARRWRVPREALDALLSAAEADGALVRTDTGWAIPKWDSYQRPDMTASERVRRYRADKSRLSPLRRNTVNNGEDTPHAGVTRRVTETLTLTGTEKTTSTPRAAVRGWRICPADFEPSEKHRLLASELRLSLDAALTGFREWEFKEPKTDANLAFFRWLRESAKRAANGSGPHHAKPKLHNLVWGDK